MENCRFDPQAALRHRDLARSVTRLDDHVGTAVHVCTQLYCLALLATLLPMSSRKPYEQSQCRSGDATGITGPPHRQFLHSASFGSWRTATRYAADEYQPPWRFMNKCTTCLSAPPEMLTGSPYAQHLQLPTCQYPYPCRSRLQLLEGARQQKMLVLIAADTRVIACVVGSTVKGRCRCACPSNHHLFATCGEDRRILLFDVRHVLRNSLWGDCPRRTTPCRLPDSSIANSGRITATPRWTYGQ